MHRGALRCKQGKTAVYVSDKARSAFPCRATYAHVNGDTTIVVRQPGCVKRPVFLRSLVRAANAQEQISAEALR